MAPVITNGTQTRRLLLIGFGGLLLLLAFAGWNGISAVRTIQNRNERIRADYVSRGRVLQQLRSDIYLSGTYVRDLLLERDPSLADLHRRELEKAHARIDANNAYYSRILLKEERVPFDRFMNELNQYFASLDPALRWNPYERQELGYAFMKHSLLPRRTEIVRLADQLSQLNERQLEAGSQQVRELFASFQQSLLIIMILSLACGALLAAISVQRLLRLEGVSSLRYQEVLQTRSALRDLSIRMQEVQESERRAISRELHDEVGQSVSGLLLGIGNVAATLSPDVNAGALAQLHELRRLAEKTVAVVRDITLLLRPSMLDDLGLLPALQWQAREVSRTKGVSVEISAGDVPEETLSDEQRTCVYRVVQEALLNVIRHAEATAVKISLHHNSGNLDLRIRDNGRGFAASEVKGMGLLGMEERVPHLNGRFNLTSKPGDGTTVHIEIPVLEFPRRAEDLS